MQAGAEGFEQRRLFQIHCGGNQVRVLDRRDGELRERAGKSGRRCAQMETTGAARTASPAMPERIERDAIANLEVADSFTDLDNLARRLMAEHEWQPRNHALGAKLPIDEVQVGATDSTRADSNQELAFSGPWCGGLDHFGARCGPSLGDCFHFARPLPYFNTTFFR